MKQEPRMAIPKYVNGYQNKRQDLSNLFPKYYPKQYTALFKVYPNVIFDNLYTLPNEDINNNEVITVDQDSGNVADEENHDDAHENEGKVDFSLYGVSSSLV